MEILPSRTEETSPYGSRAPFREVDPNSLRPRLLSRDALGSESVSPDQLHLPRLSTGKWITFGVILFIVVAVFADVITSLKEVSSGEGAPQAELNGTLPTSGLQVGQRGSFTFALDDTAGGAMDPACVGGNLTPEFKVLRVTFLGTSGGKWADNQSCGGILEAGAVVPVVITVIPLHPGVYSLKLIPQAGRKRAGSGTSGEVTVSS